MGNHVQVNNLEAPFEGAYGNGARTGLLTAVNAGSATAGHIWAIRWAPVTSPVATPTDRRRVAVISRLRARWFTIAGFTAAQEISLSLFKLTGYTAAHTGGNPITPSKKRTTALAGASLMTGRIATTGDLTAGTQTLDTDPIRGGCYAELAAAATVAKGSIDLFMSTEDLTQYPLVLEPNEGLLLRNEIAMGAGGTARVIVECDWLEVLRY